MRSYQRITGDQKVTARQRNFASGPIARHERGNESEIAYFDRAATDVDRSCIAVEALCIRRDIHEFDHNVIAANLNITAGACAYRACLQGAITAYENIAALQVDSGALTCIDMNAPNSRGVSNANIRRAKRRIDSPCRHNLHARSRVFEKGSNRQRSTVAFEDKHAGIDLDASTKRAGSIDHRGTRNSSDIADIDVDEPSRFAAYCAAERAATIISNQNGALAHVEVLSQQTDTTGIEAWRCYVEKCKVAETDRSQLGKRRCIPYRRVQRNLARGRGTGDVNPARGRIEEAEYAAGDIDIAADNGNRFTQWYLQDALLDADGGGGTEKAEGGYIDRRQHTVDTGRGIKALTILELQVVRRRHVKRSGDVERCRIGERYTGRIDQEYVRTEYVGTDEARNRRRPAGYPADHVGDRACAGECRGLRTAQVELQEAMEEIDAAQLTVDFIDEEVIGVAANRDVLPQGPVTNDLCGSRSDQEDRPE